jgi:Acyltransferase family
MNSERNPGRKLWVDYLRSAITLLVVAHHSSLAYTTFAYFDKKAYINSSCPIVDTHRWIGLDIFENFNDVFFMFLMFFIGGLFLSKSIKRKGLIVFIKDRIYRLFIPFVAGVIIVMLLAYFPAYYEAHHNTDFIKYIKDFFVVEHWPSGPEWFIWVLFAFNFLFALSYPALQHVYDKLGQKITSLQNKPGVFILLVFMITWVLYVPVAYNTGAGRWVGFGPFDFQLSRIITYFGYFMLGVLIGGSDFNLHLFGENSSLVKKWKGWILLALVLYVAITLNGELNILHDLAESGKVNVFKAWMIYYSLYVASCTASCIAFIAAFRHFAKSSGKWWSSLSENAYLIYLIHYVFLIWIQFFILDFNIPAFIKFTITFVAALCLSWYTSSLLRKIKIIHKYV